MSTVSARLVSVSPVSHSMVRLCGHTDTTVPDCPVDLSSTAAPIAIISQLYRASRGTYMGTVQALDQCLTA